LIDGLTWFEDGRGVGGVFFFGWVGIALGWVDGLPGRVLLSFEMIGIMELVAHGGYVLWDPG
jgi:hypothetical protein